MKSTAFAGAAADRAACARYFAACAGDNDAWRARFRDAFARALHNELTDRQREVLRLHYAEGLSGREIAARWGISPSAVSRHLARASARLRRMLAYNLEFQTNAWDEQPHTFL